MLTNLSFSDVNEGNTELTLGTGAISDASGTELVATVTG